MKWINCSRHERVMNSKNQWIDHERTIRVSIPSDAHMQFDASQSTVIVKNPAGHCLFALKNIHNCWTDDVAIYSDPSSSAVEQEIQTLQKTIAELNAELTFHKAVNDAE